jgi:diguanylate cyclase (GGDEF)-like protein/PAS domain S-box-containing protein
MGAALDTGELKSLFESIVLFANDVVLVTEAEPIDLAAGGPRVVYVNPAFTRMTGYRSEDIVGLTPRVLQSPKTDRAQLDLVREALRRWRPVEVELLNLRKDGSEFWVQLSITPVADASGFFTHWVAIQRDITARRMREIAVQAMLEQSTDLILLLDPDGAVEDVNVTVRPILGLSRGDLMGSAFTDLVHPEDRPAADRIVSGRGTVRVPGSASAVLRVRHRDGAWRSMEVSATDLDGDREVSVLVCTDITERVEAEARAAELGARFSSMFHDAPIGMALTDASGRFVQANAALGRMLGHDPAQLAGQPVAMITHPEDAAASAGQRRSLLEARVGRISHETRFVHADGSIVGVLHSSSLVAGRDGSPAFLVDHIEDITERQQFQMQLRHQTLHDPLTGLANRALITDRLELALLAARAGQSSAAVFFLDLDGFKNVNDTLGHAVGDRVLTAIAQRLHQAMAPGDSVGRFSGDEFVVVCTSSTADDAAMAAHRLAAMFLDPVIIDGAQVAVTASIGVAVADTRDDTAASMIRRADAAMYTAKDNGRNRVEIFDRALGSRILAAAQLQGELVHAIPGGQLRLHYQPQVSLLDGSTTGIEALVRWAHPARGLLAPTEFIPTAERSGQIEALGDWVLTEATRVLPQRRAGLADPPVMWVNLSPHQLANHDLTDRIGQRLDDLALPGSALGLEITEDVFMGDVAALRATLLDLRALGVGIAIDDFGTGYSSLSYLAQFPVDVVKIDRSFVAGLDDNDTRRESFAIVGAIIGLAHALDLTVIAEGVETANQADALHGLGCDIGQGYLYGRPQP